MNALRVYALLALGAIAIAGPAGAGVRIVTRDAVVWGRAQGVTVRIDSLMARSGTLYAGGHSLPLQAGAGSDTASVSVLLGEGTTAIVAAFDSAGAMRFSDTLRLTLGFLLRPEVEAYATGGGTSVSLHGAVLENPGGGEPSFSWSADPRNPSVVPIAGASDSVATADFPGGSLPGEYTFMLVVATSPRDTVRARAVVTLDSGVVRPFDIRTDHARWIDTAIVYGVTPYNFVAQGTFKTITQKIPDMVRLGVTALWLQPVYATFRRGQGYDVIDYFRLRTDCGPESHLRELIAVAHANNIRVLFDFVPNHTSIFHPYAQESAALGAASHYDDFYQRTFDGAPYAQHYHAYQGFVNYFWDELPNLNFDNPEVRRMITEAGKYWVENFGIDGYRVDVAWGPAARAPDFFREWRVALKRIRPDLLLLAEDKATWASVFDRRFDAAYDWAPEESWVSHWSWQTSYSTTANPTIFNNGNQGQRAGQLRAALSNGGSGFPRGAKVFRFMENNDTFRFLATHDLARTRMVAAMLFSLPGIPLIYNGQETGFPTHPYSTYEIYSPFSSIASQDQTGLFPYYAGLAAMRKRFGALTGDNLAEVSVAPGSSLYAFRRWAGPANVLVVVNLWSVDQSAVVLCPVADMGLDSNRTYYLSDQAGTQVMTATPAQLAALSVTIPAYTTRVYVIDTVAVTSVALAAAQAVPATMDLLQNFPNPFNPATQIVFDVPRAAAVRLRVFDVLGREVATLVEGELDPGRHSASFNGARFASGVYFYALETEGRSLIKKMLLLK